MFFRGGQLHVTTVPLSGWSLRRLLHMMGSSSVPSYMVSMAPVTMSPSIVMNAHNFSQAFTHMLSKSLLQILVAMQNQISQLKASNVTASGSVPLSTCLSWSPFPWILHQDLLLGSLQVTSLYLYSFPPTVPYVILSFHIHHCLAPMVPRAECFSSPANFSLQHFPHHLGSHSYFFVAQAPCHQPRIFTHPWKAGYKNKGWAICRSSRLATHKCWGPQLQATNVPGWETACVFQEQGRRDNRYCNLGGSLLILFIYGSFVALTHLDNNNRSILN